MKPKPIVITGRFPYPSLFGWLMRLSQKALNDLCRDHGVPIQKYKGDTAGKLADYLSSKKSLTITIQP